VEDILLVDGNNPKLKVHVIKLIKEKIIPRSWDTYSKLNVGQTILVGVTFILLWLSKLEKELEKALKRKRGINCHFIYENKGK